MRFHRVPSPRSSLAARCLALTLSTTLACLAPEQLQDDHEPSQDDPSAWMNGADSGPGSAAPGADAGAQEAAQDGGQAEPVDPPGDEEAEDDAEWIEVDFPDSIPCGGTAAGSVTMENTGTTTWMRSAGYKLGTVGDEDPFRPTTRVWLNDAIRIEPGQTHTFVMQLQAPDEPGHYTTDWQMVREHVNWFGDRAEATIPVECEDPEGPQRPLPNESQLIRRLAAEHPDLLADSCLAQGGGWDFLDLVVRRLRANDRRWGYNWKRGVVGEPSEDVVDYHYGDDPPEGSTQVYIIDVIVGHCGDDPRPGWGDQTAETARQGTIGRWTSRRQR